MNEQVSTTDIREDLKRFISNNFVLPEGIESLKDDDSFLENGIIDSTGVIELVMFIEETYGFQVDDEELVPENLDSVNYLVSFVENKIGKARS